MILTTIGKLPLPVDDFQESVEAKRKLNRGMTNQIQRWHAVSTESMASWLPERKHTKYPGTNRGNCVGWIGLGSQADEWTLTYGQKTFGFNLSWGFLQKFSFHNKMVRNQFLNLIHLCQLRKDMYGAKMVGSADGSADDGKEDERRDDNIEPAFYHHLPEAFYTDAIGAYEIRGCLDLTPGAGDLAKACLLRRVPYVGFGMTDQHCSLLKAQLVEFVKMQMRSEGSSFYSPEWAAAATGESKETKKRTIDQEKKQDPKANPKKKPKKKPDGELIEDPDSESEEQTTK